MAPPTRKALRLAEYDYSQNGANFVTVCLKPRLPLLGHLVGAGPRPARVELSPLGRIVEDTWLDLPNHNPGIVLGPFIVMPDHIHGILLLDDTLCTETGGSGTRPYPLPELVRQLKSFSARRINLHRGTPGAPLWQRGYYEHVIRDQADLDAAADYILTNPARRWSRENPANS